MARSFDSFQLQIIDRPFYRADGYVTPKTAKISLLNSIGKQIDEFELGIPDLDKIYEMIGRGEAVNMDSCYIQGFSVTACRRFLLLDKIAEIELNNFSASNAFFFSTYDIDFTYTRFVGNFFKLSGSTFVSAATNFSNSSFTASKVLLEETFVKSERFQMNQTVFKADSITFKNSIFAECLKDFQDADFGNGNVSFVNTDFGKGLVSFVNARFNDSEVSFKVTRFGDGNCDFRYARFGGKTVVFEQADFCTGQIDFRNVDFGSGKTSFNRCAFSDGQVSFDGAEVRDGKISFIKSHFGAKEVSFELFQAIGSDVVFDRVVFPGNVSFYNGIFNSLTLSSCQFNGTLNIHVESAEVIDLSGCIARDIVDFYSHGVPPKVCIINILGFRLLGRFYVQWGANNLKSSIYNQPSSSWADKSDQFRILKQNFSTLGRYEDEDLAYVELMRCRNKSMLENSRKGKFLRKIMAFPSYFFKLLIFDWMGLYATSPQRVIVSIIAVLLIFSGFYSIFNLLGIGDVVAASDLATDPGLFLKSAYITIITFFTIGYGEFIPLGYSRIISSMLGFFGVFLMSYFTVAFVRKILR
jgi:hypothetical protein